MRKQPTQSTLSIADAGVADEGAYSCVITNLAGPVTSDAAELAIKKLLAQYMFENDGSDAAGANDATAVGDMAYAAGVVTSAGQAMAADPNGSTYFTVPAETAYPRAGFGNGLEEGTYAMWINPGGYTGYGRLFGTFNDDSNTAIQSMSRGRGRFVSNIRQEAHFP